MTTALRHTRRLDIKKSAMRGTARRLEEAYEQRDPYLDLENRLVDRLRSDASSQDLERRMKIERQVQALK